jgi:SNF2 family DNA or RNA helicase
VVAVRLICPDTVEEKMMYMQQEKKELFHDLIPTEAAMGKAFSKDELLKLLNTPLA